MGRIYFFLFWIFSAIIVVLRIGFDTYVYLNGTTIPYKMVLPGEYQYLLHLPPGYNDFDNLSPLIVYLHGAGETDKGLGVLKNSDLWHYAKDANISQGNASRPSGGEPLEGGAYDPPRFRGFPFIVVSPQTRKHGWQPKQVMQFVEQIVNDPTQRFRIDPGRVYLSGVSMGGFGTFDTACEYPGYFAAIVPVCGGGDPEKADKLLTVPTCAFHGDADDVVANECSSKMIDAVKELGGEHARLTTLHGAGHGIAGDVYRRRDLFRRLLEQNKSKQSND